MGDQLQALDQVTGTAIDLAMKFGPKLVVALVILVAGYLAGHWAARLTGRMLASFHLEPPVRQLLERIVPIFVLGLFAIMALQDPGVELLPLIAGLGVASAGLALATQGVLSKLVADPWVNVLDYGIATSEVNQAIPEAFRRRNIAGPVPQRAVRTLAARA